MTINHSEVFVPDTTAVSGTNGRTFDAASSVLDELIPSNAKITDRKLDSDGKNYP